MPWCALAIPPIDKFWDETVPSNENHLDDPNLLIHYISEDNFQRLMRHEKARKRTSPVLPRSGDDLDTMCFFLHTPTTRMDNATLGGVRFDHRSSADVLKTAGFSVHRETKIIVHGFTSSAQKFGDGFVDGEN